tara:strand:+ start:51 stop:650 length:600 start_codon:yes stop_codon:yes gene_type:complete
MTYNKPDTKLDECIFIAEKIIPADLCDAIVKDIETREWKPHKWYNPTTDKSTSEETKELDIQVSSPELHKTLVPFITNAGRMYNQNYAYKHPSCADRTGQIMFQFSILRFNRYKPGQIMRQHHDHIHSIFDGNVKGLPAVSFILNFNNDYEGSDLFFWEDTVVKLGKGDIVMFPSNWLFPHGVTEATKGKRYSAVCWGW